MNVRSVIAAGAWVSAVCACVPEVRLVTDAAVDTPDDLRDAQDLSSSADITSVMDAPVQDAADALAEVGIDALDVQTADATDAFTDVRDAAADTSPDLAEDALVADAPRDVVADVCPVCALPHASSECRGGGCSVVRCDDGYADCDGAAGNGCERAVSATAACGACDGACGAGRVCLAGVCVRQRSCPSASERGCGTVTVPGGTFTMGENAPGPTTYFSSPEQPMISVTGFEMDAYEVTVARFRRFWDAGHPNPPGMVVYPGGASVVDGACSRAGDDD